MNDEILSKQRKHYVIRMTQFVKCFQFAHEKFFIGEHRNGRCSVLGINVCYFEEVEVRGENPFGGRGALEFSDQPHPHPLSLQEREVAAALEGGEKISRCRRRVREAA